MTETLSASIVRIWAREAIRSLEEARAQLNKANVFPVADSDTGTNMILNQRHGASTLAGCDDSAVEALRSFATGAVIGARGNSGVILAEFLRGLARGIAENTSADATDVSDPAALAAGLDVAQRAAARAVGYPAPGTILSAATAAAQAAVDAVPDHDSMDGVLDEAIAAATLAVGRGADQLEALRRAEVVDAGAVGLVLVLTALRAAVAGTEGGPLSAVDLTPAAWANQERHAHTEHATAHALHSGHTDPRNRFELMCLAVSTRMNADPDLSDHVRSDLLTLGESVVVIDADARGEGPGAGSPAALRVHIHTDDPARVIAYFDGWQLSNTVVHEFHHAVAASGWSWVALTASPGLLAPIAAAGGVALWADSAITVDELDRAITDAASNDVLVLVGDVANPEAVRDAVATVQGQSAKRVRPVANPGHYTDLHLIAAVGQVQVLRDLACDDVAAVLDDAADKLEVVRVSERVDAVAAAFGRPLAEADLLIAVHDSGVNERLIDAVQAAATQHLVDAVVVDTGLPGARIQIGIDRTSCD